MAFVKRGGVEIITKPKWQCIMQSSLIPVRKLPSDGGALPRAYRNVWSGCSNASRSVLSETSN